MGNITRVGTIDYSDLVYTSDLADIDKYALTAGDVIFNRTNSKEWVGKVAFYDGSVPAIYAGYLVRFKPVGILSEYVVSAMCSPYERAWCSAVKTDGVNQSNINVQKLKRFLIPVPPLAEQRRIVAVLDECLGYVDEIEQNQAELESLLAKARSKVLDLAIRGKLVAQDPADEPASALLERIRAEKLQMVADGRLKKKDVARDSVIYRGEDNSYYEQRMCSEARIVEEALYDLPDSWAWARLGLVSDYGSAPSASPDDIDNGAWILDLEDIEKNTGRILKFVTLSDRPSLSIKRPFKSGQLLYSKLRPYLNKVLIAPKEGFCTSEILPINLFAGCVPEYLRVFLMSDFFLAYANRCSYGVKMPRLGTTDGQMALIAFPPTNEQRRIASAVEELFEYLEALTTT